MLATGAAIILGLLTTSWAALLPGSSHHHSSSTSHHSPSSHHSPAATSHQSFRSGLPLTPASTLPLASEVALASRTYQGPFAVDPVSFSYAAQPFGYHFDIRHPSGGRSASAASFAASPSAGYATTQLWRAAEPASFGPTTEYRKAGGAGRAGSGRSSVQVSLPADDRSAHSDQYSEYSKAQNRAGVEVASQTREGRKPTYVDYFIPPAERYEALQSNLLPLASGPQQRIAPPAGDYLPPIQEPVVPPPGDYLPPPEHKPEPPADEYLPPPPQPPADEYLPPPPQPPSDEYLPPPPKPPTDEYLPPPPEQPVTEPPDNYLPPPTVTEPPSEYLPPSNPTPAPVPSISDEYLPPPAEPSEEYLPPPKEPVSPPADEYLPPPPPSDEYLPPPPPSDEYLPPPPPSDEYLPPPPEPVVPPNDQYLPPSRQEGYGGGVRTSGGSHHVDKGNPPGSGLPHLSKKVFQKQTAVGDPADPCLHYACAPYERCQEVRVPNSCQGRRCGGWLRAADCVAADHPTCHPCHPDEVCVLRKRCTYSESCASALQCLSRS